MSQKVRHKQRSVPASRPGWLWAGAGILLLLVGSLVLWNRLPRAAVPPPQVTGAPRLAVDQTTIDEGDVQLGKTIRSIFHLQNIGDQPLAVLGEPRVEVLEGC